MPKIHKATRPEGNWEFIDDMDDRYSINDKGECWSHITNKMLKPYYKKGVKNEKPVYCIGSKGVERMLSIHVTVASYFVPNPNGFYFVKHIDGDITNNCADNLTWVGSSGSGYYVHEKGLKRKRKVKS
jgi:hypothetical protein